MDSKNNKKATQATMKHWQQLDIEERLDVLEITSAKTRLPQLAIEKDWWVTLAKLRRTSRHYIVRELPYELTDALNKMGIVDFSVEPELTRTDDDGNISELRATTHPSTIFVRYKSILPEESKYIEPKVKIEISCLSMDEPVEIKTLRSIMANILKEEEDVEVMFPTVVPTRTFLEKIFLLHEEFQKENPRSKRMSRHLYDIEKIMDTDFGKCVSDKELYDSVVRHRSVFNKVDGIDYALHSSST